MFVWIILFMKWEKIKWAEIKVEPSMYQMCLKKNLSIDVEETISVSLTAERKRIIGPEKKKKADQQMPF